MSKIIKKCENCGIEFESYIKRNRKYCSKGCSGHHYSNRTKLKCICEECGLQIDAVKSRPRKFCSKQCRHLNDSKKFIDTGNPNFGKRHPNMFTHTVEAREKIKKKS